MQNDRDIDAADVAGGTHTTDRTEVAGATNVTSVCELPNLHR